MLPFLCDGKPQSEYQQDIMFFDAFLQKHNLNKNIDIVTADYENYYINLLQFNDALGLSLDINYNDRKISGWYLKQENRIDVTFSELGQIQKQWLLYENEIFIHADQLAHLLGVTSEINTIKLIVNFSTKDQHPLLAKLEREKKYRHLAILNSLAANYPVVPDKYNIMTQPTIEARINQRKGLTAQTDDSHTVNINSRFDALYHASTFSFNRNENSSTRFNMQRTIHWLSTQYRYEFGDVRPIAIPGVNLGSMGRGFRFAIDGADQENNRRRFEGNAPPGWDAELYQDGRLIAFQTITEDGRYLFENISIRFGYNAFSVRLYAPTGEFRVVPYEFFSLDRGLDTGVFSPEISYVQSGRDLLLSNEQSNLTSTIARLNYGVNETLASRLSHIKIQRNNQDFQGTGVGFSKIIGDNKFDYDWLKFDTGINQQAAFLSRILAGDLSIDWSRRSAIGTPLKQLQLNYLYQFDHMQMGVFINRNKTNIEKSASSSLQLSYADQTMQYAQLLSHVQLPNSDSNVISHNTLNFRIGSWFIQSELGVMLNKSQTIEDLRLSGRYYWRGFSLIARYLENRSSLQKSINFQLTRNFNGSRLGFNFSYDFNNQCSIGITFATNFDFQGKTRSSLQSSRIHAQVFEDKNYNSVYDEDDLPIENARFFGRHHWRNYYTDKQGRVTLPGAISNRLQTIRLDKSTLDDPFLSVANEGFQVRSHSGGKNHVDFPLWKTFEIEGMLVSEKKHAASNTTQGLAGATLWLQNPAGEAIYRTRTEYDGFFIFENILPGKYQLIVDQAYLTRKKITQRKPITIHIDKKDDEVLVLDDVVLAANDR